MRSSRRLHLDENFRKIAERLVKELGWTPSKVVGEALRILAERRRIIGFGKFKSGVSDLASNKAHLKGFGRRRFSSRCLLPSPAGPVVII
jgi:hypothetical protein